MTTTADILIETLIDWNVDIVFGLPGDGINGIMEALRTRQDRIRFIQVRHEESAAFMACAYAKWTGKLGVCLATSGPGGTHLLTGLYDAKLDQAPVLAITGMQFHDLIETFTQQDVDLTRALSDVAIFNAQVSDAAHMENLASLACRSALAKRGVAHLSIANDVQEERSMTPIVIGITPSCPRGRAMLGRRIGVRAKHSQPPPCARRRGCSSRKWNMSCPNRISISRAIESRRGRRAGYCSPASGANLKIRYEESG